MKAGSEPRPTSDTTEAMTALSITMEVVLVSGADESVGGDGHKTDSTAKKQPATAALKPVAGTVQSQLQIKEKNKKIEK